MQLSTPYNYRIPPSPNEMGLKESLHSPLKTGMSDDTLTGADAQEATCCALKYINSYGSRLVNSRLNLN